MRHESLPIDHPAAQNRPETADPRLHSSAHARPASRSFARYTSMIGFGLLSVLGTLPAKAQQNASNAPAAPSLPAGSAAKDQLVNLFNSLKNAIQREPASAKSYIEQYLRLASDNSKGASLAEKLKTEDPAVFKNMLVALENLAGNDAGLLTQIKILSADSVTPAPGLVVSTNVSKSQLPAVSPFDPMAVPVLVQPKKSGWCGIVSSWPIIQSNLGLKLNEMEVLKDIFGAIVIDKVTFRSNTLQASVLPLFVGFDEVVRVQSAPSTANVSKEEIQAHAQKILLTEIAPRLMKGEMVGLSCGRFAYKFSHSVTLLSFNPGTKMFLFSDPMKRSPEWRDAARISAMWPDERVEEGRAVYALSWTAINSGRGYKYNGTYAEVPAEASMPLTPECLKLLNKRLDVNPSAIVIGQMKEVCPDVRWVHVTEKWSPSKNIAELSGLAMLAKLCIAANANGTHSEAFVCLKRSENGKNVEIAIVDAYRGGFKGMSGELHIRTKGNPEGQWTSALEFNKFFTSLKMDKFYGDKYAGHLGYFQME